MSSLTCRSIHDTTITNYKTVFLASAGQIKECPFDALHRLD